ncbi:Rv1476 family membrane protein [Corynebacterium ulcerans]
MLYLTPRALSNNHGNTGGAMLPQGIDVNAYEAELKSSGVALQTPNAEVREKLIDATQGQGLAIAVVDQTPEHPADLRDLAQELLNRLSADSEVSTVAVRSPHTGAIVSKGHSRAELEAAQHQFFSEPDYVVGVTRLAMDLEHETIPLPPIGFASMAVVFLAIVGTFISQRRRG